MSWWPFVSRKRLVKAEETNNSLKAAVDQTREELGALIDRLNYAGGNQQHEGLAGLFGELDYTRRLQADRLDSTMLGLRGHNPLLAAVQLKEGSKDKYEVRSLTDAELGRVALSDDSSFETGGSPTRFARRDLSHEERVSARAAVLWFVMSDAVMKSALNKRQYYVLGRGAEVGSPNPDIDKLLKEFWSGGGDKSIARRSERMEFLQRRFFRRRWLHGELFLKFELLREPPFLRVGSIHPDQVVEVYRMGDTEDAPVHYIKREWFGGGPSGMLRQTKFYATTHAPEGVTEVPTDGSIFPKPTGTARIELGVKIAYYPLEVDDDETGRGLPAAFAILKWMRYRRDIITDGVVRHREASRIIWAKRIGGNDARLTVGMGPVLQAPPSGGMYIETKDRTLRPLNAQVHAADTEVLYRIVMREIGAGVDTPPQIIVMDPSDSNYASIRSSDNPFTASIADDQDEYAEILRDINRCVLKQAVVMGAIPEKVSVPEETPEFVDALLQRMGRHLGKGLKGVQLREAVQDDIDALVDEDKVKMVQMTTVDVPINITLPQVIVQDRKELSEESKMLSESGAISIQTLRDRHGVNHEREEIRLAKERAEAEKRAEDAFKRAKKFGLPDGSPSPKGTQFPGDDDDAEDDDDEEETPTKKKKASE